MTTRIDDASATVKDLITVRLISINDVYDLTKLPRFATLIRSLGPKPKNPNTKNDESTNENPNENKDYDSTIRPSAITLNGDFLYPSALSSIDNGRGHAAALRASGITHVCLGNHEADLPLEVVKERFNDLSRRGQITVLNSNVRGLGRHTREMDIVTSNCGRVRVGLVGLLSDECGMFRDGTFRGLTIENVKEKYEMMREKYVDMMGSVDCLVPLTHQSLSADVDLAEWMEELQSPRGTAEGKQQQPARGGVILGGHEHVKIHSVESKVQIVKTGQNCDRAAIVDLQFHPYTRSLENIHVHFEELDDELRHPPCPIVNSVVNKHLSALDELQDFTVFDKATMLSEYFVDPVTGEDLPFSSERTRYEQTTVGAFLCTAIQSELGTDHCIINGAPIKGDATYPNGTVSYDELRKELPFPLKMTVVEMTRKQLRDAIDYSRTNVEKGKSSAVLEGDGRIERRGYLQVDFGYWRSSASPLRSDAESDFDDDQILSVAVPRNLLKGFCKIQPLMDLRHELESKNAFPNEDDYIKAIDLVVRYCFKDRWAVIANKFSFAELDENNDGSLCREEIRTAIQLVLGEEPPRALVDGMLDAFDDDANGLIDEKEFNKILSEVRGQS